MKHNHADMIKEWADNPYRQIEVRIPGEKVWMKIPMNDGWCNPAWNKNCEYRFGLDEGVEAQSAAMRYIRNLIAATQKFTRSK